MKTVILAGGFGTRLSEETVLRPKPMVEVGGKPLLWHIMKLYAHHGLDDFIICLGYKGYFIKEYFANYFLHNSDVTFHLAEDRVEVHNSYSERWSVTLVDTGLKTMTGGRIKRVLPYLEPGQRFCLTYGDGLSNVDVTTLVEFAEEQDTLCTVTAVQPPGRFGALKLEGDRVERFHEKPAGQSWINGGFFVVHPRALELIAGDQTSWEGEPLEKLSAMGELSAFRHEGFWQPCDTLRDKKTLEAFWASESPPWRVWA